MTKTKPRYCVAVERVLENNGDRVIIQCSGHECGRTKDLVIPLCAAHQSIAAVTEIDIFFNGFVVPARS